MQRHPISRLLHLPLYCLSLLFGQISWSPPPWLAALLSNCRRRPVASLVALLLVCTLAGGTLYWLNLPKPLAVYGVVAVPGLSDPDSDQPESLILRFGYPAEGHGEDESEDRAIREAPVARIDLIGETLREGVRLRPSLAGTWRWLDDHSLEFTPERDWPPGTDYRVQYDPAIFAPDTRLGRDHESFTTPPFAATIDDLRFYQDPADPAIRRVVATLAFTHPVDADSLQTSLSLAMRPAAADPDTPPRDFAFTLDYDQNQRRAYVQSTALSLPERENYMTLTVPAGLRSLLGGEASEQAVADKVVIPDIDSFLKVSSLMAQTIANDRGEPEQVVIVQLTDAIDEQVLTDAIAFYALPRSWKDKKFYRWKPGEVDAQVLGQSLRLMPELIPNPRSNASQFSFRVDVAQRRQIYVALDKGLPSVNGFRLSRAYRGVVRAPVYPKEVRIAGDGSVLSFSGEHRLSILSRGVNALKYSVGRLLEGQIHHLISQTDGDIVNPDFTYWTFDQENLAEFQEGILELLPQHPKKANYSSLDLSDYLPEKQSPQNEVTPSSGEFGLFFVNIQGYDARRQRTIYNVGDQRLVLVTDLGLIVKNNADGSHDVFVQSIATGEPVPGAIVELLGKNGIALLQKTTSDRGHVSIPNTRGFHREQQPVVYVVKSGGDLAFIPFDRGSRQINLSRFDIGGVHSSQDSPRQQGNNLTVYGFSDRGIYRPGEEARFGFIVKGADLSNVEGIPLEVMVRGPRGNEVDRRVITLPPMGFFDYRYQTGTTADTGRYTTSVHIVEQNNRRGRQIGATGFTVEEFQPDTMKITSELLAGDDRLANHHWSTAEQLTAKVTLNNLFGLPAQNRRTTGRLLIEPAGFAFKDYPDYHFSPTSEDWETTPLSIDETLEEQTTDGAGRTEFALALNRFREGTYRLQFIAEGFDQAGGRGVVARNSTLISPLEHLVGVKADGNLAYINLDSEREVNFVAIDSTLKSIDKSGLTLKKLAIQKVSTLIKQSDGTYQYQSVDKETELAQQDFAIDQGGLNYALDTTTPGDFALEIHDQQAHRLARVNYSVVGVANLAGRLDRNAELRLTLSREDYQPGDTIAMNIKAPYTGAGLITIETDKVHAFKWFKTDHQSTVETITLPEGLEGNGYVNLTFVRDVASEEIFTSPLSYAVKPFSIDKSKRRLDIALEVPPRIRPGDTLEIGFRTGAPSKIALFAVDEGILQVADYRTPAPLEHFLQKRALQVDTLQILDLILPEFNLLKALSASGGGVADRSALAKNLNPFARQTDAPAVYWSGIVDGGPEPGRVGFTLPDTFAGSLRVMAVAVSESAFGAASESTLVRGPFVITPNSLTQAAPGDEFLVTAGVANNIEVSCAEAPVTVRVTASEHLELVDDPVRALTIGEGNEAAVRFRVKARDKPGAATLTFVAEHGETVGRRSVGLSIRPVSPYRSTFISGYTKSLPLSLPPARQLYPDPATQTVTASASPLVLVDGLSNYLQDFPHGCTEQVVSQVFPLVGLLGHPAYSPDKAQVREQFDQVILQLRRRQQSGGGFSFWPGGQAVAAYPSVYVSHFLIEAEARGYPVPADMLDGVRDYLRSYVKRPSVSLEDARVRATGIYLLTRLGEVTTNYLLELEESLEKNHKKHWRQDLTAAYMAATYQLLKKEEKGSSLIDDYTIGRPQTDNTPRHFGDFHSPLARDAQYLYLVAGHFAEKLDAIKGETLLRFTDPIFQGQYNTLSAAYSILALGAYSEAVGDELADDAIRFMSADKNGQQRPLTTTRQPFARAAYDTGAREIFIEAESAGSGSAPGLYYLNAQSGFDTAPASAALRQGLEVHRDFLDAEGNKVTEVKQGEALTVRLRVRVLDDKFNRRETLTNIALIDLLPGGFEIIRDSVPRDGADYVDIREDRLLYYGSFDRSVREIRYQVKPVATGTFTVPPFYGESMYDRGVRARSVGGVFRVLAVGGGD